MNPIYVPWTAVCHSVPKAPEPTVLPEYIKRRIDAVSGILPDTPSDVQIHSAIGDRRYIALARAYLADCQVSNT